MGFNSAFKGLMSILGQPKSGGAPSRGYAGEYQLFTLDEECCLSQRASQIKSMRRRWARQVASREEEKSKFMIFVGNLKKEGACSGENCVRSSVVTAVTLDFLSTSGRQVTVRWRKDKAPPCNFRPRSLTFQPAAEGCCGFFGNAQAFSCTNLKAAQYRHQGDAPCSEHDQH